MPENYHINRDIHLPVDVDHAKNVAPVLQTGNFGINNGTTIDALPIRNDKGEIISWKIQHWKPANQY